MFHTWWYVFLLPCIWSSYLEQHISSWQKRTHLSPCPLLHVFEQHRHEHTYTHWNIHTHNRKCTPLPTPPTPNNCEYYNTPLSIHSHPCSQLKQQLQVNYLETMMMIFVYHVVHTRFFPLAHIVFPSRLLDIPSF